MKKETIQEFLARGGKINVVPPVEPKETKVPVRSTVVKPAATILTYEEADQLYGTKTDRKEKKKSTNSKTAKKLEELKKGIDKLPKELLDKLMKDL